MSEAHVTTGVPSWDLHHRLHRALEYADVKVAEMGSYLDVSSKTMTNYLSGRTQPRDGLVRAWALRCGVSYQWLRYGTLPEDGDDGGADVLGRRSGWVANQAPTVVSALFDRNRAA